MADFHAAVIAGTHSSAGKTTWALALMSFFRKKGLTVQPFKVGPDYIDPGFHHQVCRPRRSRNLDRFFLSEDYLKNCFLKNSQGADLSIIEGVMGLHDGRGPLTDRGSTAEMAKLLDLPVFLVVNAAGMARSAAAVVKGYRDFDPHLKLKGILLNEIGSENHFSLLQEAIEKETGVPVLGRLPKDLEISVPERYLGLQTVLEEEKVEEKFNRLAQILEGRLNERQFLEMSKNVIARIAPKGSVQTDPRVRIGIAYDAAFSFYYEDNFDLLREAGAELVLFSPLHDLILPEDLDALYLGGGFPELYAEKLSENETLKNSIRKFHQEGKMIYSECGGLIYLAEVFIDSKEKKFPLVGLVPGKIRMTSRLQNFGYHEIETSASTFLFEKGMKLLSHEFHRSLWENPNPGETVYRIGNRPEGFYDGRLLATYQHLHFGQNPELAKNFVEAAYLRSKPGVYTR